MSAEKTNVKNIENLINIQDLESLSKIKNQLLKDIKTQLHEANIQKNNHLIHTLKNHLQQVYDLYQIQYNKLNINNQEDKNMDFLPLTEHIGESHPISITKRKIYKIMKDMQFQWMEAPEVDYVENIFEKLNMDELHPAREDQQSFYIQNKVQTLRTHCTNFQAHIFATWNEEKSIRKFHMGKVYRCDSDATHTPMFHQFEVLYINKDANLCTLMGFIRRFFQKFFQEFIDVRIRTSHFPFTSPSYEVDILLKGRWLEIGGCGIVHREVFYKNNKSFHHAWAWGMGVERLTMISNKIQDIRNLYKNDIRFF